MHILVLCRSLTSAQKAARIIQRSGIYAVTAKAPQGANPGGCAYGVKLAGRNRDTALRLLTEAGIPVLSVIELPERGERR